MLLLLLILLASVFYTLYDVFASKAAGSIDPNFSAVIFNGLGAIIPLLVYAYFKMSKKGDLIPASRSGIVYSLLAGFSIAIFSILFMKIFEKGELSYAVPVIYGGTIVLASIVGIILFKEAASLLQVLGIVVAAVGIAMIAVAKV